MRLDIGQTHTSCSVDAFSTYTYVALPFQKCRIHWKKCGVQCALDRMFLFPILIFLLQSLYCLNRDLHTQETERKDRQTELRQQQEEIKEKSKEAIAIRETLMKGESTFRYNRLLS